MPELPEVETVRRTLAQSLIGRVVAAVDVRRADFVEGDSAPVLGSRIDRLDRRGKELAIIATPTARDASDQLAVLVHLGMSGRVLWHRGGSSPPPPERHDHVVWTLDDGARVVFNDPRRFGGLWILRDLDQLHSHRWSRLGPDALTIEGDDLHQRLARTRRAVKPALLDQRVLAGVGNIYADESLWHARIAPRTRSDRLTPDQCRALADAVRHVLAQAVTAGGSTLRDFADAMGRAGAYRSSHAVYGRGGEPCTRCGRTLRQAVLAQRTTVWCDGCQGRAGRKGRGESKR